MEEQGEGMDSLLSGRVIGLHEDLVVLALEAKSRLRKDQDEENAFLGASLTREEDGSGGDDWYCLLMGFLEEWREEEE